MEIKEIPINDIEFDRNIRLQMRDEDMSNLMQSIKDNGLLQPIGVVEKENEKYEIVWGNRRAVAFIKLDYKKIPAVIFLKKDDIMTEERFYLINAIENFQRKPATLFELGKVLRILRKTMSVSEISVKLGIPKSRISDAMTESSKIPLNWHNRIRVLAGNNEKKGDIPIKSALKVASLNLPMDKKDILLSEISKEGLNIYEVKLIASLMNNGMSIEDAKAKASKYRLIHMTIFVDKKMLEDEMKDYDGSLRDFAVDVFNYKYKGIAVKNVARN